MKVKKRPTDFGKYIKKRLIDLDMQQRDLAVAIGTTPSMITHIIYGERNPDKWIDAICRSLGDGERGNWE